MSPGGNGYFTCIQNMKLVTNKFKLGGLHEKHVVNLNQSSSNKYHNKQSLLSDANSHLNFSRSLLPCPEMCTINHQTLSLFVFIATVYIILSHNCCKQNKEFDSTLTCAHKNLKSCLNYVKDSEPHLLKIFSLFHLMTFV